MVVGRRFACVRVLCRPAGSSKHDAVGSRLAARASVFSTVPVIVTTYCDDSSGRVWSPLLAGGCF